MQKKSWTVVVKKEDIYFLKMMIRLTKRVFFDEFYVWGESSLSKMIIFKKDNSGENLLWGIGANGNSGWIYKSR